MELIGQSNELRNRLRENVSYFREKISSIGLQTIPGLHPIVPIMLGDASLASQFADEMLKRGGYVIGFSYPVVPMDKARIRAQVSASHSKGDLDLALEKFREVKEMLIPA